MSEKVGEGLANAAGAIVSSLCDTGELGSGNLLGW